MPALASVMVVDDDRVFLRVVEGLLAGRRERVLVFAAPVEALAELEQRQPTVLVTDLQMPGIDGIELFHRGRKRWPLLRGVLVSAHVDQATLLRIAESGFHACVPKTPEGLKRLRRAIDGELAAARQWRRQLRELGGAADDDAV